MAVRFSRGAPWLAIFNSRVATADRTLPLRQLIRRFSRNADFPTRNGARTAVSRKRTTRWAEGAGIARRLPRVRPSSAPAADSPPRFRSNPVETALCFAGIAIHRERAAAAEPAQDVTNDLRRIRAQAERSSPWLVPFAALGPTFQTPLVD